MAAASHHVVATAWSQLRLAWRGRGVCVVGGRLRAMALSREEEGRLAAGSRIVPCCHGCMAHTDRCLSASVDDLPR